MFPECHGIGAEKSLRHGFPHEGRHLRLGVDRNTPDGFSKPRPKFFRTVAETKAVTAWLGGKTLSLTDGVTYARWDELGSPTLREDRQLEEVLFAMGCLTLKSRINT